MSSKRSIISTIKKTVAFLISTESSAMLSNRGGYRVGNAFFTTSGSSLLTNLLLSSLKMKSISVSMESVFYSRYWCRAVSAFECFVNNSPPFSVTSIKDFNDLTALFSFTDFLAASSSSTFVGQMIKEKRT